MPKLRLDQLLIQRELVETRSKAQALIMAGQVLVNEQKVDKAGSLVATDAVIRLLSEPSQYVSRGGHKLAGALEYFKLAPQGLIALDIGASTGGFTDCLLQKGAQKVIALDVGFNQLDWRIRSDARVIVIEKFNFRFITKEKLAEFIPEQSIINNIKLATIDVSFISLDKILPPLYNILSEPASVIALVKPQFEAKREQVGKGGIIKDISVHREVLAKVRSVAKDSGYEFLGETESQLKGTDGNQEYFIYLRKNA